MPTPELMQIPADPPDENRKINFVVHERIGTPLRKMSTRPTPDGSDWDPVFERIVAREDLKDGMAVLEWRGHDEEGRDFWTTDIVTEEPKGSGRFHIRLSDHAWKCVEFVEEDGKGEWRVTGIVNTRGLKRLVVKTEGENE